MPSPSATLDEVFRHKKALDESLSDEQIADAFEYLEALEVNRALLSKTKIGVAVARHKQSGNPVIASRSRKLVLKWRAAVADIRFTRPPSSSSNVQNSSSLSSFPPEPNEATSANGKQEAFVVVRCICTPIRDCPLRLQTVCQ